VIIFWTSTKFWLKIGHFVYCSIVMLSLSCETVSNHIALQWKKFNVSEVNVKKLTLLGLHLFTTPFAIWFVTYLLQKKSTTPAFVRWPSWVSWRDTTAEISELF